MTHSLHYADQADKICVMYKGEILEMDTPYNLKNNPNSKYNDLAVKI